MKEKKCDTAPPTCYCLLCTCALSLVLAPADEAALFASRKEAQSAEREYQKPLKLVVCSAYMSLAKSDTTTESPAVL